MASLVQPRATIGVDLGGSKIGSGLVGEDGSLLERRVVPTMAAEGLQAVLSRLLGLVADLQTWAKDNGVEVRGLGVASAGAVDPEHGVLAASTDALPGFEGLRLREHLENSTALTVSVLNDVQAMALGEQRYGVGRQAGDVLYVAVGTGVGGAFTRRGLLDLGAHGFAGDIGHIVVDASATAPPCPCGRRGHLEAFVSGPALVGAYARHGGPVEAGGDLRPVSLRAAAGESLARNVLRDGAVLLGRAVGGLVNFIDPGLVVFGGGLLELNDDLFWGHVRRSLAGEVRVPVVPRVERAQLGTDAAIVGAAVAALKAFS
jgi:glucokinase